MRWFFILIFCLISISLGLTQNALALNQNLYVSVEQPAFSNHFSGPQIVEVVIRDSDINNLDQVTGEPDVTINGKQLRMVQSSDGNWYAYFANVDKAKIADQTVQSSTDSGVGLDFGVFCSRDTPSSILGVSFSDSDGVAVPRASNLGGYTNGNTSFSSCTGNMNSLSDVLNNVVRKSHSINTHSEIPTGQIGLEENAWPIIQLFSFRDVTIMYNAAGGSQRVDLKYEPVSNISLTLDRDVYPPNSQIHTIIKDFQLNIDPTDNDSWTFNVVSPWGTFYQAYDNNGQNSANTRNGLVNLISSLTNLGFEKNGKLSITLNSVVKLATNSNQPNLTVTNPSETYSNIVTFVESEPNSGIFESFDHNNQSTITMDSNASRGQTGVIEYNRESTSILSGYSTANIVIKNKPIFSFGNGATSLVPGTKTPIILTDKDQNLNSEIKEELNVFRDTAIIPTLKIGNPVTLQSASRVNFISDSGTSTSVSSSVPDKVSSRLLIKSKDVSGTVEFEKISIDLGITADALKSSLIDTTISTNNGTNWANYDLRSIQRELGISDFSDSSVSLSFNGVDTITLIPKGSVSSQGLYQISESTVNSIFSKTGAVKMMINFDSSDNNANVGKIQNEVSSQPIVFDFFAFGNKASVDVNDAIYRLELKETDQNSSTFRGTIEPIILNQLNQYDPDFIKTITPIDFDVKFIVNHKQTDSNGVIVTYSDISEIGTTVSTSSKSDVPTNSGIISFDSTTYRFGQPVTLTLRDSDLNLDQNLVDVYNVIDDANSQYVDTVGANGQILLEVLIKDIRFKRCTISGQDFGGLASSGFSLVETGPSTGIFKGTFKMPTKICDKTGTKLISPAGGIVDAKYFDARDQFGNSNIFSASKNSNNNPDYKSNETLNQHERSLPKWFKDSINRLNNDNSSSGLIQAIDQMISEKILLPPEKSFPGNEKIPSWVKNNIKWLEQGMISDSDFLYLIQYLINNGLIVL